jgi:hypothetical protein
MKNLGTLLNRELIELALEKAIGENLPLRKSTRYSILYKGRRFPPKEIARIAVELGGSSKDNIPDYRLNGGDSINNHFRKLDFEIIQLPSQDSGDANSGQPDPHKKLVRLCWNNKHWMEPSGWEGKSTSEETHEAKYGYGHEEWLFDHTRIIDGYHYGFIEAIRKGIDLHANETFDVQFFTINGLTKERCWAGRITALEILDHVTAEDIRQRYIELGWLATMEEQIRAIQRQRPEKQADGWSNYQGLDQFNVRFRPEHYSADNQYVIISGSNPIGKLNRYMFNQQDEKYMERTNSTPEPFFFRGTNKALNEDHAGEVVTRTYPREPPEVEIQLLHEKISYSLTKLLKERYGDDMVEHEYPAGFLSREIDIVAQEDDGLTFYEIKTYPSLIKSIRAAIGQLMEYALWQNTIRAKKWIIITQPHPDSEAALKYLSHVRENYGLPLYYQSFDWKNSVLSPLVPIPARSQDLSLIISTL